MPACVRGRGGAVLWPAANAHSCARAWRWSRGEGGGRARRYARWAHRVPGAPGPVGGGRGAFRGAHPGACGPGRAASGATGTTCRAPPRPSLREPRGTGRRWRGHLEGSGAREARPCPGGLWVRPVGGPACGGTARAGLGGGGGAGGTPPEWPLQRRRGRGRGVAIEAE